MFDSLLQFQALQEVNEGHWFDPANGALVGPLSNWKPIPENSTQSKIEPYSLILHSNAGLTGASWYNLWAYMNRSDVTGEPHFDIDMNGNLVQAMSIFRRADCNASANQWTKILPNGTRVSVGAISIETGDNGSASLDNTPWGLGQLSGIIAIGTALACQYGTGCNEVLTWDGHGIDYHTKFPYIGIGQKAWSIYAGKTCPGRARKLQTPWIRQAVAERVINYITQCNNERIPHGIAGL